MAAHQYWRLTGFLTDSNVLELSQAQLYDGATLIAQAPTFTVAPTTGAAFPDTLHWDDFSMPGFALVWDLSTPVANPNLRLGAGSSAGNFPKELYCQYSDDGTFWSTNNAPDNVAFPGAGLLTAEPSYVAPIDTFIPLAETPAPKRWRTLARPAEPMVGSPMQDFNIHEFTPQETFMDAYHGGRGIIRATVKRKNTPENTPLLRRVDLLDEHSRLVIRSTWSDSVTGIYAFSGIREDLVYTVVSYDLLHDKRAVIADNLTLANGGVELLP